MYQENGQWRRLQIARSIYNLLGNLPFITGHLFTNLTFVAGDQILDNQSCLINNKRHFIITREPDK